MGRGGGEGSEWLLQAVALARPAKASSVPATWLSNADKPLIRLPRALRLALAELVLERRWPRANAARSAARGSGVRNRPAGSSPATRATSSRYRLAAVACTTHTHSLCAQNYRNETVVVDELGPHTMRKRALKSGRKKKEWQSKADPKRQSLRCPPPISRSLTHLSPRSVPWGTREISLLSVPPAASQDADWCPYRRVAPSPRIRG